MSCHVVLCFMLCNVWWSVQLFRSVPAPFLPPIAFLSIRRRLPVASMTSRSFNLDGRFNIYVVTRRMFIMCKEFESHTQAMFSENSLRKRRRKYYRWRLSLPKKGKYYSTKLAREGRKAFACFRNCSKFDPSFYFNLVLNLWKAFFSGKFQWIKKLWEVVCIAPFAAKLRELRKVQN